MRAVTATDLTLPETALIIQALSRPSVYNVRKNLALARKRAYILLAQMLKQGFISKAKAEVARAKLAGPQVQKVKKPSGYQRKPHFGYFGQYVFKL